MHNHAFLQKHKQRSSHQSIICNCYKHKYQTRKTRNPSRKREPVPSRVDTMLQCCLFCKNIASGKAVDTSRSRETDPVCRQLLITYSQHSTAQISLLWFVYLQAFLHQDRLLIGYLSRQTAIMQLAKSGLRIWLYFSLLVNNKRIVSEIAVSFWDASS